MDVKQLTLCLLRDELEMLNRYMCTCKCSFSARFNHHRYLVELSRAIVGGEGEAENLVDGGTGE